MIRQDDRRFSRQDSFDNWIVEAGCYVFSWLWYGVKYLNVPLGIEEIRAWIRRFQSLRSEADTSKPALDQELFLWDPNVVARALGFTVTRKIRAEGSSYFCRPGELEFLWWFNPRTGYHHMTPGNGTGIVTCDSLGRSVTVSEGYIESKRIIEVGEAA